MCRSFGVRPLPDLAIFIEWFGLNGIEALWERDWRFHVFCAVHAKLFPMLIPSPQLRSNMTFMIILSLYNTICQEMYYAAFFDLVAMVVIPHFRSLRRLVAAAVVALAWIYLVLYTRHRHTIPILHSIGAWLQP